MRVALDRVVWAVGQAPGSSVKELSTMLGVPPGKVWRWLRTARVERRVRVERTKGSKLLRYFPDERPRAALTGTEEDALNEAGAPFPDEDEVAGALGLIWRRGWLAGWLAARAVQS